MEEFTPRKAFLVVFGIADSGYSFGQLELVGGVGCAGIVCEIVDASIGIIIVSEGHR